MLRSRRGFITGLSGASLLGVSGCLSQMGGSGNSGSMRGSNSDCVISESTDNVEPISVTADGRLRGADVEVEIRWNARTQATIDTGERTYYDPPTEDARIVVVRAEITNPSDTPAELRIISLGVQPETPNAIMDDIAPPFAISGYSEAFDTMTLRAGATVSRVILFEIDDLNVTSVTMQPRPILETEREFAESEEDLRTTLAFNPTCDEGLAINAPPRRE